jgi:hypothetical protein
MIRSAIARDLSPPLLQRGLLRRHPRPSNLRLRHVDRRNGRGRAISEYWKYIAELPGVSSCLVDSCHVERRQPPAPLHGVVFDILAAGHPRRKFL